MKYYIQEEKVFQELSQDLLEWAPGTGVNMAMDIGIFQRVFKDEYRNAILQGYTPEKAKEKATQVAVADWAGGMAMSWTIGAAGEWLGHGGSAATAGVTTPLTSGAGLLFNTGMNTAAGEFAANHVGDRFDRENKMGQYHPDGKKQHEFTQAELDSVPFDDKIYGGFITLDGNLDQDKIIQSINDTVGVGNLLPKGKDVQQWMDSVGLPQWLPNPFASNRTEVEAALQATQQREQMGVKEAPGGGYYVDERGMQADEKYGKETEEARKKRIAEAQKLADKLNQQLIDKGFRPKDWKPTLPGQEPPAEQPPAGQPPAEGQQPPAEGQQNPPGEQPKPGTQGVPPIPVLPPPTTGPNAGQSGPGITTPTPENQEVSPEVQQRPPVQQQPGTQERPPAAEPGSTAEPRELTPFQQWAQKYPHLAQRLKPGQAGYDEIKDMDVVKNAKQPTAGGIERRTPGPLIGKTQQSQQSQQPSAQQQAAKVRQQVQQARQDMDRAAETRQRVATQNAQAADNERKPQDPMLRTASRVRDAGQKYGDKAFSTTLRPQKAFEPLKKKKIGDPLGESLEGLMDFLLD